MLTLKCSKCKTKLFKYKKIGPGRVLRCHKDRITRLYSCSIQNSSLKCFCGQEIGRDMGSFYKMNPTSFTFSGTKDTSW